MKFKRVLTPILMLIPFMGLASCVDNSVTTATPSDGTVTTATPTTTGGAITTSTPTTIVTPTTAIPTTTSTSTTTEDFDKDKGYDAITRTCTLNRSFEGKDFIKDGIGEATISQNVDGDTAVFKLKNKASASSVKARFYAIDTPESTAKVEKWGKSASKFTASKLQPGVDIVLESTGAPAEHDSYERYFAYVWYKDTDGVYKNLNLEIVENGYSESRAVGTNPYYDYFRSAEDFAKSNKMHIHSDDEDPNYSDTISEIKIQTLNDDLKSGDPTYYDLENGVGAKVIIKALILDHTQGGTAGSITHYFTIGEIDEDNKMHTFNVFAGYSSDPITSYLIVGSYVHLIGTVQKYNGQYQLAVGGTYVSMTYDDNHTHILQRDYICTFDSTAYGYDKKSESGVRGDVTISNATLEGTTLTIVGSALMSSKATETTEFTFIVTVDEGYNYQSLIGKTVKISNAIQKEYQSNHLEILDIKNIVIK